MRIFYEILSGFRDKFQKRVTCFACSIEFAKTNQKMAEKSEIRENHSLFFIVVLSQSGPLGETFVRPGRTGLRISARRRTRGSGACSRRSPPPQQCVGPHSRRLRDGTLDLSVIEEHEFQLLLFVNLCGLRQKVEGMRAHLIFFFWSFTYLLVMFEISP